LASIGLLIGHVLEIEAVEMRSFGNLGREEIGGDCFPTTSTGRELEVVERGWFM
jgi:hypothetical protein